MWKNDLGLLLAAVILSLLVTIFHYQLGLGGVYHFFALSHIFSLFSFLLAIFFFFFETSSNSHSPGIIFFSLVLSVFFATGAGIIRGVTPFRGTSCGKAVDLYPIIWQPFVDECSRIVSIQAIAWTLCTFFFGLCNIRC
jgi:hypothetical protein